MASPTDQEMLDRLEQLNDILDYLCRILCCIARRLAGGPVQAGRGGADYGRPVQGYGGDI